MADIYKKMANRLIFPSHRNPLLNHFSSFSMYTGFSTVMYTFCRTYSVSVMMRSRMTVSCKTCHLYLTFSTYFVTVSPLSKM